MLEEFLANEGAKPVFILDGRIPRSDYTPIDLSTKNEALSVYDMTIPEGCQAYIDTILAKHKKQVAFGGYLEERGIYGSFGRFSEGEPRNIHLGMDFWCAAGIKVMTPLHGKVHSFKNNDDVGNYGPTIILEHTFTSGTFYTLYGHLSLESLEGLYKGKVFPKGELLATLGTPDINVNYAPHLHFQVIKDMQGHQGDYPGVCSLNELDFYQNNCPDPNLLFGLNF